MIVPYGEKPSFYNNELFEGSVQNFHMTCPQIPVMNVIQQDEQPIAHRTRTSTKKLVTERENMKQKVQSRKLQHQILQEQEQQNSKEDNNSQDLSLVLPQTGELAAEPMLVITPNQSPRDQMIISEPLEEENEQLISKYLTEQTHFQNINLNIAQTVIVNQQQYWHNHTVEPGQDVLRQVEQTLQYLKDRVEYSIQLNDNLRQQSYNAFSRLGSMCTQANLSGQENHQLVTDLRSQTKILASQVQDSLQDLFQRDQTVRETMNAFVNAQKQQNFKTELTKIEFESQKDVLQSLDKQIEISSEALNSLISSVDDHTVKMVGFNSLKLELLQVKQEIEKVTTNNNSVDQKIKRIDSQRKDLENLVKELQSKMIKTSFTQTSSTSLNTSQQMINELRREFNQTMSQVQSTVQRVQNQIENPNTEPVHVEKFNQDLQEVRLNNQLTKTEFSNQNQTLLEEVTQLRILVNTITADKENDKERIQILSESLREQGSKLNRQLEIKVSQLEQSLKRPNITIQESNKFPQSFTQQTSSQGVPSSQFTQTNSGFQSQRRSYTPYEVPKQNKNKIEDLVFQNRAKQNSQKYSLWYDQEKPTSQTPSEKQSNDREAYYEQLAMMDFGEPTPNTQPDPTQTRPQSDFSDYAHFKFDEQFDGNHDRAFVWLDRFLTQVNKYRLTESQIFAQIRYLLTQAAETWFQEYQNTHGFQDVNDFLIQFQQQYSVDQLKLHTKFHQTNRRTNESAQEYLNRLRALAIPAQINTNMVKEKFLLSINQDYPNLDPFTILRIQRDQTISTQDVLNILQDHKDKQDYQRLVTRNLSAKDTSKWSTKISGGKNIKPTNTSEDNQKSKDADKADSSKPKTTNKSNPRFRGKKPYRPYRNQKGNLVMTIGEQLCEISPLSEEDLENQANSSCTTDSAPQCEDEPDEEDEGQQNLYFTTQLDQSEQQTSTMFQEWENPDQAEVEYVELQQPQYTHLVESPHSNTFEHDLPNNQMTCAQSKMEEECILLDLKLEKAIHNRDSKLQQYCQKYDVSKDPKRWEMRKREFQKRKEQQSQHPMWRINYDLIQNSPKHFIKLAKQLVEVLDRPTNFLRTETSLAQANKWLETLQRRYDSLGESVVHQSESSNKYVQTINALTVTNTSNFASLPQQGMRYLDPLNKELSMATVNQATTNKGSQTIEISKAQDSAPLIYAKIAIKSVEIFAMIDTGATLSAISRTALHDLGLENQLEKIQCNVIVMDDRKVPITQQVKDCVIQFDETFAVRTNLIVCEKASWSLLLGRNVQEAAQVCIIKQALYYQPPYQSEHRRMSLYTQKWKRPVK